MVEPGGQGRVFRQVARSRAHRKSGDDVCLPQGLADAVVHQVFERGDDLLRLAGDPSCGEILDFVALAILVDDLVSETAEEVEDIRRISRPGRVESQDATEGLEFAIEPLRRRREQLDEVLGTIAPVGPFGEVGQMNCLVARSEHEAVTRIAIELIACGRNDPLGLQIRD
jgi:hypothetical protein